MNNKSHYRTRQQQLLREYLEDNDHQHFTVNDIADHFQSQGINIGTATIYRQLEKMIETGEVNKYIIDASSPACFEYVGHQHHEGICFHCKCEKCGKLIHLHCEELETIQTHLLSEHNFRLDPLRTVFYGICEQCAQQGA